MGAVYIAVTNEKWFATLKSLQDESRGGRLEEVNFWAPSDRSFKPENGDVILFKLKNRGKRIGGYGFFVRSTVCPVSIAWRAFEKQNGADSYEKFAGQIGREPHRNITCRILAEPVFLEEEKWIEAPGSWHESTISAKKYDFAGAEGQMLWRQICGRTGRPAPYDIGESVPSLVRQRLGQRSFRLAVMDVYEKRCAVTGEKSLPVLEAAHIIPHAKGGAYEESNGLFLRADIHKLFDHGYVSVQPQKMTFEVSAALRDEFANGKAYYNLEGRKIYVPSDAALSPARSLEWHYEEFFRK